MPNKLFTPLTLQIQQRKEKGVKSNIIILQPKLSILHGFLTIHPHSFSLSVDLSWLIQWHIAISYMQFQLICILLDLTPSLQVDIKS